MKRVIFSLSLILSTFIFPWWVSILMSILGLLYFENLYEVILVGLIIDVLYGVKFSFYGFNLFFTAILTSGLYLIVKIKTQIFV
jgi:hypothetical protein